MTSNQFIFIIINGIQPYLNEINSFLAPQEGVTSRVRYKLSWMPEIDNINQLNEKEGFLILRNYYDPEILVPLRSIKVKKVNLVGEVVYIEFYLGKHIAYSDDRSLMVDQLKRATKTLTAFFKEDKYQNKKNEDLKNLIFFGADIKGLFESDSKGNEISHWGILVEFLSSLRKHEDEYLFDDFDFIKVVSVRADNGLVIGISYEQAYNENIGAYKLKSESKIYFDILQRTFTRKHGDSAVEIPRRLCLAFYDKYLYPARSNVYIVGKYDLLTLSLITSKTEHKINTEAFIEINRENDRILFPINIPLIILPRSSQKWLKIFSIFIFILSFFCYLFSEKIALHYPEFLTKEGLKDFLLPILILSGSNLIPNIRDFVLGRLSLS